MEVVDENVGAFTTLKIPIGSAGCTDQIRYGLNKHVENSTIVANYASLLGNLIIRVELEKNMNIDVQSLPPLSPQASSPTSPEASSPTFQPPLSPQASSPTSSEASSPTSASR
jgi:hypothetical protein